MYPPCAQGYSLPTACGHALHAIAHSQPFSFASVARCHATHATQVDLEHFAAEGLRTLLVAERELDEDAFTAWEARYRTAVLDPTASKLHLAGGYDEAMVPNNDIDRLMEELEAGLSLLGATAIEDKLQDGVPAAVAALRESGTKVSSPPLHVNGAARALFLLTSFGFLFLCARRCGSSQATRCQPQSTSALPASCW